jgi:hypothetical protein
VPSPAPKIQRKQRMAVLTSSVFGGPPGLVISVFPALCGIRNGVVSRALGLTPVISATKEAEIRKIVV